MAAWSHTTRPEAGPPPSGVSASAPPPRAPCQQRPHTVPRDVQLLDHRDKADDGRVFKTKVQELVQRDDVRRGILGGVRAHLDGPEAVLHTRNDAPPPSAGWNGGVGGLAAARLMRGGRAARLLRHNPTIDRTYPHVVGQRLMGAHDAVAIVWVLDHLSIRAAPPPPQKKKSPPPSSRPRKQAHWGGMRAGWSALVDPQRHAPKRRQQ